MNDTACKKHISGINPVSFYGDTAKKEFEDSGKMIRLPHSSREFRNLFSPSVIWKTFRKQQEVLDFVSANNCDLFPFVFQTADGGRIFFAAHPVSFWFVDEQRSFKDRHSYEIICEYRPCKLYFDLEFDARINAGCNGQDMVKTFVSLVNAAIKCKYGIVCDEKDVLSLDSTTKNKFSCHLVYPSIVFENNYSAGHFVKQICYELKSVIFEKADFQLLSEIEVDRDTIVNLFVLNDKNKRILFCDEGVYTKNRHFRLYKSSKYGKNVALRLSETNAFPIEGADLASKEEFVFLNSLVTYFDSQVSRLLTFEPSNMTVFSKFDEKTSLKASRLESNECTTSPFRDIDICVNNLVSPGHIYRSTFFREKKIIVYDIIGNRFCRNIGRQHKSNNVMYVVNMNDLSYYQKCYDPDCANFKSESKKLPIEGEVSLKYGVDDKLVLAAVEQCELVYSKPTHNFYYEKQISDSLNDCTKNNANNEDELLVAVTEQCEVYTCFMDDWNPILP